MNYPNGIKKTNIPIQENKTINYKNRGMSLEEDINLTNTYYLNCNKAVIYIF